MIGLIKIGLIKIGVIKRSAETREDDGWPTQAVFWLEWGSCPSYSACMHSIWLPVLLLCLIVLPLCGAVYTVCRSWRRISPGKRIIAALLLSPHFLFLVCIVVSVLCGHPPQGSPCFNRQFICAVLMVFILPVPALAGTITALIMFRRARMPL